MKLAFWMLVLVTASVLGRAQDHGSISGNPFSTPEDATAGAKSFRSQCAACHGLDAAGGSVGPSLTAGSFKSGGSDAALFRTITGGVPGTAMVGLKLSGREVWQVITFLRAMNIAKAADQVDGDAAKGASLFHANGCGQCHTNGLAGGLSGPDLSELGSRRSLQQIESSIVEPDADVASDYWSVRARTKAGQTLTGIRLNEDMDSIQLRDPRGALRSLRKAELTSFEILRTSPMPSFKTRLTSAELRDLVAYLASLRAQPIPEETEK